MQNKTYTSSFKFKVLLELLQGNSTIAETLLLRQEKTIHFKKSAGSG